MRIISKTLSIHLKNRATKKMNMLSNKVMMEISYMWFMMEL